MREIVLEDNPEVSVIIPIYNAERFIGATLDSLVKQSYRNFEAIVVDDGSTDRSKEIVEKFSFDRRLRYVYKENSGTGDALNLGHSLARGKYLLPGKEKCLYYPTFIETFHLALSNPDAQSNNVHLIYSDFQFVQENGQPIRPVFHKKPQTGSDLAKEYNIGISLAYTKELWTKTGPYWNKPCEDYHWCVRAAQYARFGLINGILAGIRIVNAPVSRGRQLEEAAAADDCRELARNLFCEEESVA